MVFLKVYGYVRLPHICSLLWRAAPVSVCFPDPLSEGGSIRLSLQLDVRPGCAGINGLHKAFLTFAHIFMATNGM